MKTSQTENPEAGGDKDETAPAPEEKTSEHTERNYALLGLMLGMAVIGGTHWYVIYISPHVSEDWYEVNIEPRIKDPGHTDEPSRHTSALLCVPEVAVTLIAPFCLFCIATDAKERLNLLSVGLLAGFVLGIVLSIGYGYGVLAVLKWLGSRPETYTF